ncbi:hypothetical protein [Streptomyces sp. NPDC045470]|uniref:hypothetical protein n=1 Tax=Streptomyces sp. NPDC045470 TaxID=3155469 RepID=UPI0033FA8BED
MRTRTATAVGVLSLAAAATLLTTGAAMADSHGGWIGWPGPVDDLGRPGHVGWDAGRGTGRDAGRDGRNTGAVTIGKHTSTPSVAAHNWGGNNWNSKVVFGDMNLG